MSATAILGAGALALALSGCSKHGPAAAQAAPPPPIVTVAAPVEREITDYRDFTGRTAAVESVVVRARVTGYLDQVCFKEGADVEAGALLYEIDPRPYQATLDQAEGNVTAAEAKLARLELDLGRSQKLLESGVVSQEDLDRASSERAEAAATLQALRSAVEGARLDLEFTHIHAPIAGRTSRTELKAGNLVQADDTALTTIVSLDPIHAEFDVDERSALLYRALVRANEVQSARVGEVPVWVGLSDEEDHPHRGMIDFVDNRLDPSSGTIRARAILPNSDGVLAPGLFVRVRVPFSQPHPTLMVDERAVAADQRGWYVLVVGADGTVEHRSVVLGAREEGRVAIERGLAAGESVIVNGIQRARPGTKVDARQEQAPAGAKVPDEPPDGRDPTSEGLH